MEHLLTWSLVGLAVLLSIGWYLSYLAGRLDRLHHRVESSWAALEAQLARRAAAALEAAAVLPPDAAAGLVEAASAAVTPPADRSDLEVTENRLTRQVQATFGDPARLARWRDDAGADGLVADLLGDLLGDLAAAASRVQLARRFHNDAVLHAQRMRGKRVVRWARLAGRAAWPVMIELDDSVPEALTSSAGQFHR